MLISVLFLNRGGWVEAELFGHYFLRVEDIDWNSCSFPSMGVLAIWLDHWMPYHFYKLPRLILHLLLDREDSPPRQ